MKRQARLADTCFDIALRHKKNKNFDAAIAAYEKSIELGIENLPEVHSNLGVLYSEMQQLDKAQQMYARAIAASPDYIPALLNMAGLCEERGQQQQATDLYHRILAIEPHHALTLSRLVHARTITAPDTHLMQQLRTALEDRSNAAASRETLFFALGKALDDLGSYDEAFAAYQSANDLAMQRHAPYNRAATEAAFAQLVEVYKATAANYAVSGAGSKQIFICGMLRSGSTLIEKILATHTAVTAGGELDLLPWLAGREFSPFPQAIANATRTRLISMAEEYRSRARSLFPAAEYLTDKRPENFVHIGLIRMLFPAAKIVWTKRHFADNGLSIYFQQLGGNLHYATDLTNIAHYRRQHDLLMEYWLSRFGDSIFVVDYDEFVRRPEPELRRLIDYLGLDWQDGILKFETSTAVVRTASLWQVRQALHPHSSGRWRNYEKFIAGLTS
jgi:Tfp pilus assembly protein PilF